MVRKTCYFFNVTNRRRALYLSLVRSQFEYRFPVWSPTSNTRLQKFDNFQKFCIKWNLSEEFLRYNTNITYILNYCHFNLLPIRNILYLIHCLIECHITFQTSISVLFVLLMYNVVIHCFTCLKKYK